MISCVIVDDEPLALSLLADNISRIPFLSLQAAFDDAISANLYLQENTVDLVFVDVEMPGITGLQLISRLPNKPMVIIVSAYRQFALEGFDLDVVDYIVKPVPLDRFIKACHKAKELYEMKTQKPVTRDELINYIFVNEGHDLLKVVFDEVVYIEGLRDYVKIHFCENRKHAIARASFKNIEAKWPPFFIRIHKSFVINTNKLTAITRNSVRMGDKELPLGDSYRQAVVDLIENSNSGIKNLFKN